MNDDQKFPFELPTGDESPAKNPPVPPVVPPLRSSVPPPPAGGPPMPSRPVPPIPPAGVPPKPEVKIATGGADFFSPETFQASPVPPGVKAGSNIIKNIAIALVVIIFVGGIGALSYFVIFPLLFPSGGSAPAPVSQAPTPLVHQTFLVQPPAASVQLNLNDHKYLTIMTALQGESFNQLVGGQSKEVQLSEGGQQLAFPVFLSSVSPASSALSNSGYFENDFTTLFYYDANGVWPVYVAKLKTGTNPADAVNAVKSIEGVLDVANFYLAPPGTFAVFKDGKVGNYATRYAVGSQAGASFNYGVLGNYFVISTSYNGLKAAAPLLGL